LRAEGFSTEKPDSGIASFGQHMST
jgi:hypothetical protein